MTEEEYLKIMSKILQDLDYLKKKVDAIEAKMGSSTPRQESPQTASSNHSGSQQSAPVQQTHQKGSFDQGQKSTHPRTGGYSSTDVSLEKVFYFGNK